MRKVEMFIHLRQMLAPQNHRAFKEEINSYHWVQCLIPLKVNLRTKKCPQEVTVGQCWVKTGTQSFFICIQFASTEGWLVLLRALADLLIIIIVFLAYLMYEDTLYISYNEWFIQVNSGTQWYLGVCWFWHANFQGNEWGPTFHFLPGSVSCLNQELNLNTLRGREET